MDVPHRNEGRETALEEILGYLNFSSGRPDPRIWRNYSDLYGQLEVQMADRGPPWRALAVDLERHLDRLAATKPAFAETTQVRAVIRLAFDRVLRAYREFHRDLLFHQPDLALFRPFFLARACDLVLAAGAPWEEESRIVESTVAALNDFVGHRPVAVLENERKLTPYPHEWVAPIPIYYRGAGAAVGRYRELVERALELLSQTEPALLAEACFELQRLDELALDPRAYDFYHPVNRRPNYQFGQWDPHLIDNQGYYRRFVLEPVTIDALVERVECSEHPRDEVLFESAAVLAGTILMASGMSGYGPETHDSDTSLSTLVPRIAAYRDRFYVSLLDRVQGPHADRLREEARALRQPFGGTRQELNARLARQRATQLEHVHVAQLYARMGFPDASLAKARRIQVPSARLTSEIECLLRDARRAAQAGDVDRASTILVEARDLLTRAIECGALVDPWNILGFQGHFSVFRALENSVRDPRVPTLMRLVEELFAAYAIVHRAAAVAGRHDLERRVDQPFEELAQWWDRFAMTTVEGVRSPSGAEAVESARHVSRALLAWHQAGSAAGDITFWRTHVAQFASPKTFALVVEALLDARDFVASMALLMAWLNQSENMPLEDGERSFHDLACRWMLAVLPTDAVAADESWGQAVRFFDRLEANADEAWNVPELDLAHGRTGNGASPHEAPPDRAADSSDFDDGSLADEDAQEGLFSAAYEDVTYRDSTDDGIEGETIDSGKTASEFELEHEAARLGRRLDLINTYARLWRIAAESASRAERGTSDLAGFDDRLSRALENRERLEQLLGAIHRFRLAPPHDQGESLIEFDRRRMVQQSLLDRVIDAYVATSDAARWLRAALPADADVSVPGLAPWEQQFAHVLRVLMRGDPAAVQGVFPALCQELAGQPLLYVPLARRGDPRRKAATQSVQVVVRDLLGALPRLGLFCETVALVDLAQDMEKRNPVGAGAVTEFNRLFQVGFTAVVEAIVEADPDVSATAATSGADDEALVECIEAATENFLARWLRHSRSARISVLERVSTNEKWQDLRSFVERYGDELFTQKFLNLGNLRAILHQGADTYLRRSAERDDEDTPSLVAALERGLPREPAVAMLELVLEAVIENYAEYEDYNTTTTQSDRGSQLFTLLDFLRLKASYERVAWNLRPVVLAHEVVVRSGRAGAAELWRRSLTDKTREIADWHVARFDELVAEHGMRLASVADRLGERFVQPLDLGRLRALVDPAMTAARAEQPATAQSDGSFARLEQEIDDYLECPTGVGIDLPGWLAALEEEVEAVELGASAERCVKARSCFVPRRRLKRSELTRQLDQPQLDLEQEP